MGDAAKAYDVLRHMPFIGWRDDWVPAVHFEGDWIFTECGPQRRAGLPVGRFLLDSGAEFEYHNLTRYVRTINASIVASAAEWNDGWWIAHKPRELGEIHRTIHQHGAIPDTA